MSWHLTNEQKFEITSLEEISDKLYDAEKYAEALEKLKELHSKLLPVNPTRVKTLMMMAECNIFLDEFDEAIRCNKKFMDPSELSPPSNAPNIFDQSVDCQECKLFFRSLNYAWWSCALYFDQPLTQASLEGIVECMQIMDELLSQVFNEYGFIDSKSKHCTRFAEVQVRFLLEFGEKIESLGRTGEFTSPDTVSLLDDMRLCRAAGIASCYLLLRNFQKSVEYFDQYVSLADDEASSSKLNLVVGKFAAKVGSCYEAAQSELTNAEKRVAETREAMAKYEATDEHDPALLNDTSKFMEDYVANIRDVRGRSQAVFKKLLRFFFRN